MQDMAPAEALPLAVAPRRAVAPPGGRRRPKLGREALSAMIEAEILPRLVAEPRAIAANSPAVLRPDPDRLAQRLIDRQAARACASIYARLRSGAPAVNVILEDLAPAARRLGDLWRDDACDFLDVTIATRALRDLLRDIAPDEASPALAKAPSLLVAPAPGETHEFGAEVISAMFRFAGWRTVCCGRMEAGGDEALSALAWDSFDVAAFSLSCERYAPALAVAIRQARAVSRNRRLSILIGGPALCRDASLALLLGADLYASGEIDAQFPCTVKQALRL